MPESRSDAWFKGIVKGAVLGILLAALFASNAYIAYQVVPVVLDPGFADLPESTREAFTSARIREGRAYLVVFLVIFCILGLPAAAAFGVILRLMKGRISGRRALLAIGCLLGGLYGLTLFLLYGLSMSLTGGDPPSLGLGVLLSAYAGGMGLGLGSALAVPLQPSSKP